ncbi:hypothetical protein GCM10010168_54730 [Actinoplanes ianthinogenes]|uniref:Uncharacterized protein n=1 Tax=Actinoplanes ianthinogenes TaxID=122358 RepID=A0ABM7LQK3_9ACTN|nr:hypothetical protein Aiant_21850 [Actinoplanes ianthinogenes]GGR29500.1 hypothetical protein GCM10010168_54730 [Actinoplanes ianthinogenes]
MQRNRGRTRLTGTAARTGPPDRRSLPGTGNRRPGHARRPATGRTTRNRPGTLPGRGRTLGRTRILTGTGLPTRRGRTVLPGSGLPPGRRPVAALLEAAAEDRPVVGRLLVRTGRHPA